VSDPSRFEELLDRVERGESVTITQDGSAVAELIPVRIKQSRARAEVIAELLDFGKNRGLEGSSIREMIDDGRRF
jgi:antitoxin (DNA-binding transcriptional repressor) of toxin-antitoxin stability system